MNSVKQYFTLDLTNSIGVRRPQCLKAASPLGVKYLPRPKPVTPAKRMQAPGNVGSEVAETSKKRNPKKALPKMKSTVDNSSKLARAANALTQRKSEAAKVQATEKDKKRKQEVQPVSISENRDSQKRKAPELADKSVVLRIDEGASAPTDKKQKVSAALTEKGKTAEKTAIVAITSGKSKEEKPKSTKTLTGTELDEESLRLEVEALNKIKS